MSLYRIKVHPGPGYTFPRAEAELHGPPYGTVIAVFDEAADPGLCQRIADVLEALPSVVAALTAARAWLTAVSPQHQGIVITKWPKVVLDIDAALVALADPLDMAADSMHTAKDAPDPLHAHDIGEPVG